MDMFILGVLAGPFIWVALVVLVTILENIAEALERAYKQRKWDKTAKKKAKLERELAKINEKV